MSESNDELQGAATGAGEGTDKLDVAAKGVVKPKKKQGGAAAKPKKTPGKKPTKKKSLIKVSSAAKAKAITGFVIVVVLAVAALVAWNIFRANTEPHISASLIQVIERSDLKCASSKYEGICAKSDERFADNYEYAYTYVAQASVYLENLDSQQNGDSAAHRGISVDIDKNAKVVKVTMPESSAFKTEVNVSTDDIQYVAGSTSLDPNEAVQLAKEDAMADIQDTGLLIKTAKDNAKVTVEGMLRPLLKGTDYKLEIVDSDAPASTEAGQSIGEAA